jgi:hypothetical protein
MEVPAIGVLSRPLSNSEIGFALLKECDERLDGGLEFRRCSSTQRIEHHGMENGGSHPL